MMSYVMYIHMLSYVFIYYIYIFMYNQLVMFEIPR